MQTFWKIIKYIWDTIYTQIYRPKYINMLLSTIHTNIFMKKRILNTYGLKVSFNIKWYIEYKFKEWFKLKFIWNPIIDIIALYGYIQNYKPKTWDIVVDWWWYYWLVWLFFSKLVWDNGKVIIFEPDDNNYKILNKNLKLNELNNVIIVKKWLWSRRDKLTFNNSWTECSSIVWWNNCNVQKNLIAIDVVNLIDELNEIWISNVNYIKLDIEWAEIEVIKWMKKYLENHNVNFAIASYHVIDWDKETTSKRLEKMFKEIWYKCETKRNEHLTTYARK